MVDTNNIRKQLIKITRKTTDKRLDNLTDDVLELCNAYDEVNTLAAAVKLGNDSLQQSFDMIENLRKSL